MLIAEHSMCQPGRPGPDRGLERRLAGFGALPEGEVADVVLAVLVGLDPLPDPQPLRVESRQSAIGGPRRDPVEDRAALRPVGVTTLEERRDERDDLVDVACGARHDVRGRHPKARRVGQERREVALGKRLDRLPGRRCATDDLVVDVGDVHHPGDRPAAPAQVADEQVREQERPEVADMGRSVDGRAARVNPDSTVMERDERARLARERVVQLEAHRPAATEAMTSAEMLRPAPSAPSRLPLDALTLTADGSRPSSTAIASRIGSR